MTLAWRLVQSQRHRCEIPPNVWLSPLRLFCVQTGLMVNRSGNGRNLVHHQPIQAEFPHHLPELFKIHRLLDVAVDAGEIAFEHVLVLLGRSQHHHRDHLGGRISFDLAQHLVTVHFGQL